MTSQYFTVKADTHFIQLFLVSTCHKSWGQLNIKMQSRESYFVTDCDNVVKVMEISCGWVSSKERTQTVQWNEWMAHSSSVVPNTCLDILESPREATHMKILASKLQLCSSGLRPKELVPLKTSSDDSDIWPGLKAPHR